MEDMNDHARNVMLTVLESLELGEPAADNEQEADAAPALRCAVDIAGEWNGAVVVSLSPRLATWIARRMFGADAVTPTTLPDDCREAAREVSNIVAGNLKPLLGGVNVLGLPTDITTSTTLPALSLASVTVEHHGEPLAVQVLKAA